MPVLRGQQYFQRMMRDTCQKGTISNRGKWGSSATAPAVTWDSTNTIQCWVNLADRRETNDGSEVTLSDGTCWMPAGTTITGSNAIKLTHRDRTALGTNEVYRIIGDPMNLRTGLSLHLRLVEGGGQL